MELDEVWGSLLASWFKTPRSPGRQGYTSAPCFLLIQRPPWSETRKPVGDYVKYSFSVSAVKCVWHIWCLPIFLIFFQNLGGEACVKTLKLDDSEASSRKCFKILKIMVLSHQKWAEALNHRYILHLCESLRLWRHYMIAQCPCCSRALSSASHFASSKQDHLDLPPVSDIFPLPPSNF